MPGHFAIEVTTRHATITDSLPEAWEFVMARLDRMGPDPSIYISPMWVYTGTEGDPVRRFEVQVEGMVTEPGAPHE